jgi:glycosyltransferase involved in cell wall biosynthesis
MQVTVVISTFNSPDWLEKVLWGYSCQTDRDFSIIIADDGSGPATSEVINRITTETGLDITHIWHEHKGYRRQTILNQAILGCKTDYLIFTDGDCIPRNDFIRQHMQHAEPGRFVSGGYCKVSMKISKHIRKEDILTQDCFRVKWLTEIDRLGYSQRRKLSVKGRLASILDNITTAKPTFNNSNTSVWRKDIISINGYDERMKYGGPDREVGERLTNAGITGKQVRHRAIVLHLEHERAYKTIESIQANALIRSEVKRKKLRWTDHGIVKSSS